MDGPYWILTRSVARYLNPFLDDCWALGAPVTRAQVRRCIASGRLEARRNCMAQRRVNQQEACEDYDAARIAYFVVNGIPDPIDLEIMGPDDIRIDEGCHRLAAAIFRKDEFVMASYGGYVDVFHRTFRKKHHVTPPLSPGMAVAASSLAG